MKKSMSVEELPLSKKIKNSLYFLGGIKTLGQLMDASEKELLQIRGIGVKGIEEIRSFLSSVKVDE